MVVSILVASAPVDARSRMTLGVSVYDGGSAAQVGDSIEDFTSDVGAKPRIWTLWSTWGDDDTREFPTEAANVIRSSGATPLIFWEPMAEHRADGSGNLICEDYSKHKIIAQGKFDGYIRQWARKAKQYNGPVLLRYAHEINATYFPWTVGNCGNTAKQFKNSWRHVYRIFRNVGARNVKFVWTVAKMRCPGGCNPFIKYYPGDAFVQYAGFSNFNWGVMMGVWNPMLKGVAQAMRSMKQVTRKPIIIAELGTAPRVGPAGDPSVDKPKWIRQGYPAVYKRFPQIKGIVYLNVDLGPVHPDWSLDGYGGAVHDAYGDIAKQRRFKGRIR